MTVLSISRKSLKVKNFRSKDTIDDFQPHSDYLTEMGRILKIANRDNQIDLLP